MKRIDALKRDNCLVDFIFQHKGNENAVSSKEIAYFLTKQGFQTREFTIHTLVSKIIIERKLPICSLNSIGYYWATSKTDIEKGIEHLNSRIAKLQAHINFLESFIIKE